MSEKSSYKTSIGGSALIEGVMMQGPEQAAMAVRKPDGTIHLETWDRNSSKAWYKKTPFLRGMFNLFDSMILSYKCLMKSAEFAGLEEEEATGFEKWLQDKLGDKFGQAVGIIAMFGGMLLAISLFIVLPTVILGFFRPYIDNAMILSGVEATTKFSIFIIYILAISKVSDIKRVFEYHGAEHKTIACYEAGNELIVENVKKQSRLHPRCGTSFIVIVLIISTLIFSAITWENIFIRIILKFLCLPLVVGIAYEIIRIAGRHDNVWTRLISAPGLWMQKLTTSEPDDSEIEIAIASMIPCIPKEKEQDRW